MTTTISPTTTTKIGTILLQKNAVFGKIGVLNNTDILLDIL
jgi:hypothetical protein